MEPISPVEITAEPISSQSNRRWGLRGVLEVKRLARETSGAQDGASEPSEPPEPPEPHTLGKRRFEKKPKGETMHGF